MQVIVDTLQITHAGQWRWMTTPHGWVRLLNGTASVHEPLLHPPHGVLRKPSVLQLEYIEEHAKADPTIA